MVAQMTRAAGDNNLMFKSAILAKTDIVAATRPAFVMASRPLKPYPQLLPRPTAVLPTRAYRMDKVTRQAEEVQKYRSLAIDHEYFHALPTKTDWQSIWRPARDLPMPLLLRCHGAGVLHAPAQVRQDAVVCTDHMHPEVVTAFAPQTGL